MVNTRMKQIVKYSHENQWSLNRQKKHQFEAGSAPSATFLTKHIMRIHILN